MRINSFSSSIKYLISGLALVLLFISPYIIVAQSSDNEHKKSKHSSPSINFDHISIEEGLSQSSVFTLLQDKEGFMWFGTLDGLNRYDGYEFKVFRYDAEQKSSISDNIITVLYEDSEGTLWVGTSGGGLNKFQRETETFVSYQHNAGDSLSIGSNKVLAIFEDKNKNIWVGTQNGGLNRFNPNNETFTRFTRKNCGLRSNTITSIIDDEFETIWVGTKNGLYKMKQTPGGIPAFKPYFHHKDSIYGISSNEINIVYKDQLGVLWIGTNNGLNKYDPIVQSFISYQHNNNNKYSLSNNVVRTVFQDKFGILWVGTDNGLNKFDREAEKFIRYQTNLNDPNSLQNDRIWCIDQSRSGNVLWIGTDGGADKFDRENRHFIHYHPDPNNSYSLPDETVWALSKDSEGVLWVGTDGGGLSKLLQPKTGNTLWNNEIFVTFKKIPGDNKSLSNNIVRTIHTDKNGNIWIGTKGGGLNKLTKEQARNNDVKSAKFIQYKHEPDNDNSLSNDNVYTIFEDVAGIIWIGTNGGGLNRFDPYEEKFMHFKHNPDDPTSLPNNYIWAIHEDYLGTLWVATGNGLAKFDRQTEHFTTYRHDPENVYSISSTNTIRCIYEDKSGVLWVGTYNGLNKFNREEETFIHYKMADGLPSNMIYGILEDDEANLWLSTGHGLSKFNPLTETFKNYDVNDGLQSNEFNYGAYFKDKNGKMYFGGINGFNVFNPKQIGTNTYNPPIVFTKFSILNQEVEVGKNSPLDKVITQTKKLTLTHRDYVFSFEFAALDFSNPEKIEYAYKLDGFDKNWIYTDSDKRFAAYSNLEGGDYKFRLTATNSDGVWGKEEATIDITIIPPFWKTLWFQITIILLLLMAVVVIYRIRMNRMKRQKAILEKQVAQRTKEIKQQNEKILQQSEMLKSQAEDLKEINHRLEELSIVAKGTDNAVIIMDAEGNFKWVNNSFTRMFGYTLKELIEERSPNIIGPRTPDEVKRQIERCLRTKSTINYEYVENIKGKKIYVQANVTPILDQNGNIDRLVLIDSDITKLKTAQNEIRNQKKELELQRDELQRINKSKNQFYAIITRDIKKSYLKVIGFAKSIIGNEHLDKKRLDKYKELLETAEESMNDLIDNLATWTDIQTGNVKFKPEEQNLTRTITQNLALFQNQAALKGLKLIQKDDEKKVAYFDKTLISKVLQNLLANAIKYTEQGEINVSILENESEFRVSVADTGIGMSQAQIEELFHIEKFKPDAYQTTWTGGGIGLMICKAFVELHGGNIEVQSKTGEGSTFSFIIPKKQTTS